MTKGAMKLELEGFEELDNALSELSQSQGKAVVRRSLNALGQPIADDAAEMAPIDMDRDYGEHLYETISVSTRLDPKAKKTQRRIDGVDRGAVMMHVGPGPKAFHAFLQEYGTAHHAPQPFMRPAWDKHRDTLIPRLKELLWENIERRLRLNAKKADRSAKKGK